VLAGRDTLAVLPTGSGKSAIYQLAASEIDGPTIVVSPLIALQQDQVRSIGEGDVGVAAEANSTLTERERDERIQRLRDGELEYLFVAPEQLNGATLAALRDAGVSLFVVDETHCISDWGHDFRPDYLRLGAVIDELGHPTVLALTATAAPPVRREIADRLRMRDPAVVVRGFDRPNLYLSAQRFEEEDARRTDLRRMVAAARKPGIVYVATRRAAEELADELTADGVSTVHYHGGMRADDRRDAHERFLDDDVDVIVATPAFGMGIDKPNVRFVFHAQAPDSLDSYYQEIGRAGRDGDPASARLFFRDADLGLRRYLGASGGVDEAEIATVAGALAVVEGGTDIAALSTATGLSDHKLHIALSQLEDRDVVRLRGDGDVDLLVDHTTLLAAAEDAAGSVESRERYEASRLEMLRTYSETTHCRGRLIVNYYGEDLDGVCGHCDTCLDNGGASEQPDEVPFPIDSRVSHPKWGPGTVIRYEQDRVTVVFDDAGYRTLALDLVVDRGLLQAAD
jgi:ATP-dependent DNA helicase RecQ